MDVFPFKKNYIYTFTKSVYQPFFKLNGTDKGEAVEMN